MAIILYMDMVSQEFELATAVIYSKMFKYDIEKSNNPKLVFDEFTRN